MSAQNSEDLNNDNPDLVEGDDTYQEAYEDDVDSSDDTSDDWSDDEQSDAQEAKKKPAKKKSKSTIFIIIAVVIFGVFGLLVVMGSGQQPPVQETPEIQAIEGQTAEGQPSATPVEQVDATQAADPNAQAAPVQEVAPIEQPSLTMNQSGMMDDPSVLKAVVNQDQGAVVTPIPQAEPEKSPEPPALESNQPVETAQVPAENLEKEPTKEANIVSMAAPEIKPVSDFPTADSIKKPEAETSEVVAQPVENPVLNPVESSDAAIAEKEAKLAEAVQKLDVAEKRIVELEKAVSDKEAELSEQKQTPPVEDKSEEIETLKSKISDLENKLQIATISKPSEETVTEAKQEVKEVSNVRTSPKKLNPEAIVKAKNTKPAWVLKGANSRTAIIYNNTNSDMKTVSVGDEVTGLGKIISILQGSSGWVVKATNGSVFE
jgi:nitrate reductase NapE component